MKLSEESQHVVKMFDFDFDRSGLAFIVMERGDRDLEKALINKPTLSISQQKILWRQILNIFLTLHNHSLVCLDNLSFHFFLSLKLGTYGFKTIQSSLFW
jgi:hypothetical protein